MTFCVILFYFTICIYFLLDLFVYFSIVPFCFWWQYLFSLFSHTNELHTRIISTFFNCFVKCRIPWLEIKYLVWLFVWFYFTICTTTMYVNTCCDNKNNPKKILFAMCDGHAHVLVLVKKRFPRPGTNQTKVVRSYLSTCLIYFAAWGGCMHSQHTHFALHWPVEFFLLETLYRFEDEKHYEDEIWLTVFHVFSKNRHHGKLYCTSFLQETIASFRLYWRRLGPMIKLLKFDNCSLHYDYSSSKRMTTEDDDGYRIFPPKCLWFTHAHYFK